MANFQIKGLEFLNESEKQDVNKIIENSYDKIKRKTKIDFMLKIVVKILSKTHEDKTKDGEKRKNYSVRAGISGTVRAFEASADDWDLHKAVHMVLEKLENEVEHVFHSSEQHS